MNSKEYTSITAQEFRNRLRQNEPLSFLKVSGTVSLSRTVFEAPISINDCLFESLDFNQSTFNDTLQIRRCEIKILLLQKGEYLKKVDLKNSELGKFRD